MQINLNEFSKLQAEITAEYADRGMELTCDEADEKAYERYKEIYYAPAPVRTWRTVQAFKLPGKTTVEFKQNVLPDVIGVDKRRLTLVYYNGTLITDGPVKTRVAYDILRRMKQASTVIRKRQPKTA